MKAFFFKTMSYHVEGQIALEKAKSAADQQVEDFIELQEYLMKKHGKEEQNSGKMSKERQIELENARAAATEQIKRAKESLIAFAIKWKKVIYPKFQLE